MPFVCRECLFPGLKLLSLSITSVVLKISSGGIKGFDHKLTLLASTPSCFGTEGYILQTSMSVRQRPNAHTLVRKHLNVLHRSKGMVEVFRIPPVVAYRRDKNLCDAFVYVKTNKALKQTDNQ